MGKHGMRAGVVAVLAASLAIGTVGAGRAMAQEVSIRPASQAFVLQSAKSGAGILTMTWAIAPGYVVYRKRVKAAGEGAAVSVGAMVLPAGTQMDDPTYGFGPAFANGFTMQVPYKVAAGAVAPSVAVTIGGCHHANPEVCLPPYTVTIPVRS